MFSNIEKYPCTIKRKLDKTDLINLSGDLQMWLLSKGIDAFIGVEE
jgi:hypothetical protein